ncbi:MAG: helix-turn-helix transcriptional regulator [Fretibacterium sp.]|nr:helix-turn-helix transcriptional regulator [Fretibacterium sp.]
MPLEIVRQKRLKLGLTKKEIARKIGLTYRTIKNIESLGNRGGDKTIRRLAKILGLPFDDIRAEQDRLRPIGAAQKDVRRSKTVFAKPRPEFMPGEIYSLDMETLQSVRKEGIHHMFMSPSGGWLTSYTDAQLIGVYIKGV